jgi:hypothetical protein
MQPLYGQSGQVCAWLQNATGRIIGQHGVHLAFLFRGGVYDRHGLHLGWWENGHMRDHCGAVVIFSREAKDLIVRRPGFSMMPASPAFVASQAGRLSAGARESKVAWVLGHQECRSDELARSLSLSRRKWRGVRREAEEGRLTQ